jgi:hypothetical protein
MLQKFFSRVARVRLACRLSLAAAMAMAITDGSAAEGGVLRLRCTNPVGGANWSVAVDLDHGLVDAHPATISGGWIKWTDGKGGIYELERATGKLQLRAASTTGGYFLHYVCQSE